MILYLRGIPIVIMLQLRGGTIMILYLTGIPIVMILQLRGSTIPSCQNPIHYIPYNFIQN